MVLNFRKFPPFVLSIGLLFSGTAACGQSLRKPSTEQAVPVMGKIDILQRWTMPTELREISGIATYKGYLVAIQDEKGILFIFDPASGTVVRKIPFAGPGDYEGIAIAEEAVWVLRADGRLFEVAGFWGKSPVTHEHATPLDKKADTEGLFYDAPNSRLLISVKGKVAGNADGKGVYAFDLRSRRFVEAPVYNLKAPDGPVHSGKKKKSRGSTELRPSEIALHPVSGVLFVLDGPAFRLYEMDAAGRVRRIYPLPGKDLPQAEGLAFSPDGLLYISSEGRKGSGTIVKVRLEP